MSMANPGDSTADRPPLPPRLPPVGPYQPLRLLGEGAMGLVYLAEQTRPLHRLVALKIIRPGLGSKQVVARFERERQALAMMNHPHVAQVYDAGETDDHRPYFVMEYVDGIPVTKYCDTHKLGNTERLNLVLKIGEAVQHAHQKGIIHRDIKPSNILVSGPPQQPVPKVIDFGVAKAVGQQLTADTFATQFGQLVGTPAYMSPEQANPMFEDVDIRSDVYSLGVLLYELISGVLPFDFERAKRSVAPWAEIQRVILEEEPSFPSTRLSSLGEDAGTIAEKHGTDIYHLRRELKGDLDCIAMQALEKDRAHRYQAVSDLTQDIERYLRFEPISRRRKALAYRVRKFIRRRRTGLALSGLAAALVLAVSLGSAAALRIRSLDLHAQFLEAKALIYDFPATAAERLFDLIQRQPGNIEARNELAFLLHRENRIDEAKEVAQAIIDEGRDAGPAHLLLAQIYKQSDQTLWDQHLAKGRALLPDDKYYHALALPRAEAQKAVELLTELLQVQGTNFDARWNRAWRFHQLGKYEAMFKDAEFLTIARPNSAAAWNTLGLAQRGLGQLRESVESFTRAIDKAPQYAFTYLNRADSHRALEQYSEALQDCNLAIELDPDFASAYAQRAGVYLALDQAEDAQANCDHALRLQPGNPLAHWYQARLFRRTNANSAALAELDAAVAADPENPTFRFDRAELHRESGSHRLAVEDYTAVLEKDGNNVDALFGRARSLARLDQPQAALNDFNRAIELAPKLAGLFHQRARLLRWEGEHAQALADNETAVSLDSGKRQPLVGRAITRWLLADLEGAVADLHATLTRPADGGSSSFLHLWLWQIHLAQGQPEEADAALRAAEASARSPWEREVVSLFTDQLTPPQLLEKAKDDPEKCEALYYIGAKALAEGRPTEAAEWFRQTLDLNFREYHEYDLARALLTRISEPAGPAAGTGF